MVGEEACVEFLPNDAYKASKEDDAREVDSEVNDNGEDGPEYECVDVPLEGAACGSREPDQSRVVSPLSVGKIVTLHVALR
eukprot:CAMPEP_0181242558 /NCGR_PEP_ID=MMETSP1096-20121128/41756_1 /TAXON_ID=156174 ORGANISM="Chrysochromulina ericina, Strain CCMP281" /NCGR_SAMPLE_ID=MMETSP1096 /ASSEMBLY_ACC=CAM_ASM_000453 /LENGTH=80 /DNA_ID=CAMNT_0023338779 /DNA_START=280 /DNA_END=522 /DNA_ORIENTATION=+